MDEYQPMTISCDECTMQHTSACDDCVVTFICGREPDDAVVIDAAEAPAVRLLSEAGLLPSLRHSSRTGCRGVHDPPRRRCYPPRTGPKSGPAGPRRQR